MTIHKRIRTDKMHPLPWRHETDGRKISAVMDAEEKVVCGSLLMQQPGTGTKDRQTHRFIVIAANNYKIEWYFEREKNRCR